MTNEETKSCIATIEMLQELAYNINGVMDIIDADNCKKIIKILKQEHCEDCVSRKVAKEYAWNLCLETSYDNEKVVEMLDDLPSVKPVACIGTVKFSKEDMQKIVDDAVKELVLENAR